MLNLTDDHRGISIISLVNYRYCLLNQYLNLEKDDKSVYYSTQNGQEIDEDYVEKV